MAEPIISVSGLRGVVGETLTPEVAIRYAAAFAATLPPGDILIGRDSRPSGRMLSLAIQAGLQALGRTTVDAGIIATPTAGVLLRHYVAAGAIQITASHNPAPYNGLKLFSSDGRVIPAEPGRAVLQRYRTGVPAWMPQDRLGSLERCEDSVTAHLLAVLDTVDAERIRKERFRVVLDSNHGAGSIMGRRLLHELGCRVTVLGEEPDGQFAHPAEPTAENLAGVLTAVVNAGADIGFCQDPDADRLAVIDAAGRYLGEEYTLAMCVDHVLRPRKLGTGPFFGEQADSASKPKSENMDLSPSGAIVANCASSRMSQDLAERYGVRYFRSAVGEANVVDTMLARDAVFGGEGNGGPIDPRVGYVRDSFVGMAQLLDAMTARQMSIAQLAGELPRYEIVKTKMHLSPDRLPAALDALEKQCSDAASDRLDGLRLDWPNRWLLVRGSNTEPIVRAIAEAPTAAEAMSLCEAAATVLTAV
jgi:phosphomannomutase